MEGYYYYAYFTDEETEHKEGMPKFTELVSSRARLETQAVYPKTYVLNHYVILPL